MNIQPSGFDSKSWDFLNHLVKDRDKIEEELETNQLNNQVDDEKIQQLIDLWENIENINAETLTDQEIAKINITIGIYKKILESKQTNVSYLETKNLDTFQKKFDAMRENRTNKQLQQQKISELYQSKKLERFEKDIKLEELLVAHMGISFAEARLLSKEIHYAMQESQEKPKIYHKKEHHGVTHFILVEDDFICVRKYKDNHPILIDDGSFAKVRDSIVFNSSLQVINSAERTVKRKEGKGDLSDEVRGIEILEELQNSEHILKIFSWTFEKDEKGIQSISLITEKCPQDLLKFINKFKISIDKAKPNEAQFLFKRAKELVKGVRDIHSQRFIHSDIKPENILLDEEAHIKICDFGLAASFDEWSVWNANGKIRGTFGYLHPYAKKQDFVHTFTDLWALGVTLYMLFFAQEPLIYQDQSELNEKLEDMQSSLDEDLDKIIMPLFQLNFEQSSDAILKQVEETLDNIIANLTHNK